VLSPRTGAEGARGQSTRQRLFMRSHNKSNSQENEACSEVDDEVAGRRPGTFSGPSLLRPGAIAVAVIQSTREFERPMRALDRECLQAVEADAGANSSRPPSQ